MNLKIAQELLKKKEFGRALEIFLNLTKNDKNNPKLNFYLGLIYSELNDYKKSISFFKKCLEYDPNSSSTLYNLAIVYQSIGNKNEAKNIYLKLIKKDKYHIRPYLGLHTLDPNYVTEDHYENIIQIEQNKKITYYEKSLIFFILSKREKNKKNYKQEIQYLNDFHKLCFNSNYQYNLQSEFYYKKIINKHYNKIKISNFINKKNTLSDYSPIFIIGLPRSGSTLVETLLTSSDNKIVSCGESHVINMSLLSEISNKIFKKNFSLDKFKFQIDYQNVSKLVNEKYQNFNVINQKKMFIDKSLENFFNIELILKIFPKAKFIHTYRNYSDSVISIYQSLLFELSWVHKIDDIIVYIDNYIKVIKYFNKKYEKNIINVNLENLTKEKDKISKDIFNFCGLKWDKKILNFYKRKDLFIKTLSGAQVRNAISIYNGSKYKNYLYLMDKFKKHYSWVKY